MSRGQAHSLERLVVTEAAGYTIARCSMKRSAENPVCDLVDCAMTDIAFGFGMLTRARAVYRCLLDARCSQC